MPLPIPHGQGAWPWHPPGTDVQRTGANAAVIAAMTTLPTAISDRNIRAPGTVTAARMTG